MESALGGTDSAPSAASARQRLAGPRRQSHGQLREQLLGAGTMSSLRSTRVMSSSTIDMLGEHHRTAAAKAKESQYESMDYDIVETNLHVLAQRSSDSRKHQATRVRVFRWILTGLAGVFTAFVASFIDIGVRKMNAFKFSHTYNAILRGKMNPDDTVVHFWIPLAIFVGINCAYTLVAALLVSFVEPVSRGSGIPEVKCYLNGVRIPRVVRILTLVCKAIGVLFSVAGGLPVGKEGPMIHAGAVVAAGLSQGKSTSLGLDTSWTKFQPFRNDHEKRDFVACGAAAGVAAAFGAPVGGALFALEEGTTHWSDFMTWRTFVCAMVSGFTLNLTLSGFNGKWGLLDTPGSITFGSFRNQDKAYTVNEMPLFFVLGAIGGLIGALFNEINKTLTIWRKRLVVPYSLRNVMEVVLVTATVATVSFVMPYKNDQLCTSKTHFETPNAPLDLLPAAQFYCGTDANGVEELNDYALLFFQPSEESIKMLFHSEENLTKASLIWFTVIYFFFACWTYGIAVPSGLFVPSLLLGASVGRLFGECVAGFGWADSQPGVYSLIGAAAVLGGMSRMTISLTVILIEATNDYTYGLPLMLTLITARWVGNCFNDGLYDIHIHLNCVPLLESDSLVGPWEQSRAETVLLAKDVMSPVSRDLCLLEVESVQNVVRLLESTKHNAFPVVEPDSAGLTLIALVTRRQLCLILANGCYGSSSASYDTTPRTAQRTWLDLASAYPHFPTIEQVKVGLAKDPDARKQAVDLGPFMSPTPYTIQSVAPLTRVSTEPVVTTACTATVVCSSSYARSRAACTWLHVCVRVSSHSNPMLLSVCVCLFLQVVALFRPMALRHLPVVDKHNSVVGMITRKDLVEPALVEALASVAGWHGNGSHLEVHVPGSD